MIKHFFVKHRAMMLAALLIAVIYAVMFFCGITCPIRYVFGVSCPGCGMTRACMSALCLDFGDAFAYCFLPIIDYYNTITKLTKGWFL